MPAVRYRVVLERIIINNTPRQPRSAGRVAQGDEMNNIISMTNGKFYYYGNGAEGWRWYQIAKATEVIADAMGNYDDGVTVEEAYRNGTLRVHDVEGDSMSGTPYWED